MHIVYRAANIVDAHLVKGMLEEADMPAFVQGEYLQGAMGELPAGSIEPLVCVADENAAAARALIREWESAEHMPGEDDDGPAEQARPAATGGYSLGKGLLLLFAVVAGGGLAMALLRRYAEG